MTLSDITHTWSSIIVGPQTWSIIPVGPHSRSVIIVSQITLSDITQSWSGITVDPHSWASITVSPKSQLVQRTLGRKAQWSIAGTKGKRINRFQDQLCCRIKWGPPGLIDECPGSKSKKNENCRLKKRRSNSFISAYIDDLDLCMTKHHESEFIPGLSH